MQNLRLSVRLTFLTIIIFLIYCILQIYSKALHLDPNFLAINDKHNSARGYNEDTQLGNLLRDQNNNSPAGLNQNTIDKSNNNNNVNNNFDAEAYKKSSNFISDEKLEELRKSWDAQLEIVKPVSTGFPCEMTRTCPANTHFPFRVRSGAASVIGPWICVSGVDVMRSVLNNVDRGMNIALVDGSTGKAISHKVFDLYGKDDKDLITFLNEEVINRENAIIFATSYDDAAMRLGKEAREIMRKLQFEDIDNLQFRDNFVFVGGVHSKSVFQKVIKHDPKMDKYGDWPESIEVEGCIERI